MKNFIMIIVSAVFVISTAVAGTPSDIYSQIDSKAVKEAADDQGNIIPDFSRVGYMWGDKPIPDCKVVITLHPPKKGKDATQLIQQAIDKVSAKPIEERGAILLKKGTYNISGPLYITADGIVLRGEGCGEDPSKNTVLVASDTTKYTLITIGIKDTQLRAQAKKKNIKDSYVPSGRFWVRVTNPNAFKVKDEVIVTQMVNNKWISDIKMDQILERADGSTKQWNTSKCNVYAQRVITKISADTLWFENPIVQIIEEQYGGGAVMKYTYDKGRTQHCGIENMFIKTIYTHDEDEAHGWTAIEFDGALHCWARNIEGKYFGLGLISITRNSKNISVIDCKFGESKSIITGSRRYSFNVGGQLSLVMRCHSQDGRHCFQSSPMNSGPNVFVHCTAIRTHGDIGPHHRWNVGTLYDNVVSDGRIAVFDRGNYGSGHGWAGATNVFWNCTARQIGVQNPWANAKNYSIGSVAEKWSCRYPDRPDGVWISQGKHVSPQSLYDAQLELRHKLQPGGVFDVK